MSAAVRVALDRQAEACQQLGSPFTATLLKLLADCLTSRTAVGQALLDWPGDPVADALGLRIAGGLHAVVLAGKAADLAGLYPPHPPAENVNRLWQAIDEALTCHGPYLLHFIESPPQTNEVARSGALAGGFAVVAMMTEMPLAILEIGASAGLNLHWDWFRYDLGGVNLGRTDADPVLKPGWQGPPPPTEAVSVQARAGCDRHPVDRMSPADLLRLRAYIWPDQTARLQRLDQALGTTAASSVKVDAADAADWIEDRLEVPAPGLATVLFHSIVWQYLGRQRQGRLAETIEKAGGHASRKAPFAWLRMEPGPNRTACLDLTLWPGGRKMHLADVDYHGRWVRWHRSAQVIRRHFELA